MPCLYFSFSRKDCQIKARELARSNLFKRNPRTLQLFNKNLENSPPEINKLKIKAEKFKKSIIKDGAKKLALETILLK